MNSSQKNEELAVVFDIGSGSIGGALVSFRHTGVKKSFDLLAVGQTDESIPKPKVIFSVRTPIYFGQDFSSESLLAEMTKALAETAGRIEHARLGAPQKAYCFLASPWQASQTRIIRQSRHSPFVLSAKTLSELAEKEINHFGQIQAERYKAAGEGVRLVNSEIMQVKLNGYKTAEPFGQRAKEMEAALFVAISPDKVLDSLRNHIQKFFNLEIKFWSFPFASFAVARDIFPETGDFLFVDVAGELSDISLVRDEVLEESISFPRGKNYFIREAGNIMNKNIEEAKTLAGLYFSGRAEAKLKSKIEAALERPKNDWLRSFGESLLEISGQKSLPERIFFSADDDAAEWLKLALEGDQRHQYTVTAGKFNVTILKSGFLQQFCGIGPKAGNDIFIILESIFINRVI